MMKTFELMSEQGSLSPQRAFGSFELINKNMVNKVNQEKVLIKLFQSLDDDKVTKLMPAKT